MYTIYDTKGKLAYTQIYQKGETNEYKLELIQLNINL